MKIGFDAKRAFLNTSGLGNYSRNTIHALQSYHPVNDYILFSPKIKSGKLHKQEEFKMISPSAAASKLKKTLWRYSGLTSELEQQQVQLFHGLSNELPRGIHKTQIPAVVTIHDLIFLRHPYYYKFFDRVIYQHKVNYACRKAQKVIAISEQTKNDIIELTGTDNDKIEVIHQAISPVFFDKNLHTDVHAKYKLPRDYILAVGTIEERKNQLSILKALHEQNIDVPLVLVGNPTAYTNDLHRFMARHAMQKQVIFLKNIAETDLAALYQSASLSVYISVYEGFGLPVIESMAKGCPVITSNVSCLPETAGGAAVLCSPDNIIQLGTEIKKLLGDSAYKNQFIRLGLERAQSFRPEKYAENLISLYKEIVEA
jgi:glycosyltransferase involved in cell wall biosynthesis